MGVLKFAALRRFFCGVFICVLWAASASAAVSDEEFIEICKRGSPSDVKAALSNGANIKANHEGWTPLETAATYNADASVIKTLIDAGVDVDAKGDNGGTALIVTILIFGSDGDALAKTLIDAGADVNAKDNDGFTSLLAALRKRSASAIKMLIDAGANVNAKGRQGNTPLRMSVAFARDDLPLIKMLIDAGADVNAKNDYGDTPLLGAAVDGNVPVAKLLIDAGADKNMLPYDGRRQLDSLLQGSAGSK